MFKKAVPIWVKAKDYYEKLNTHLIFKAEAESLKDTVLKLTASDFYKLYVNGRFVGFGPARTAKGYARVDEYDLSEYSETTGNEIIVMVAGYYCRSLSTVCQESFFVAELLKQDQPILYSGRDFGCYNNTKRVKKVERYSVQRHFGEIYNEDGADIFSQSPLNTVAVNPVPNFIERQVPYADFSEKSLDSYVSRGEFTENGKKGRINAYSFDPYDETKQPMYGVFKREEIEFTPFRYSETLAQKKTADGGKFPAALDCGQWMMFDFNTVEVGFIQLSVEALEDTQLILAFCELCSHDEFVAGKINAQNVVQYNIKKGVSINAETFEPYGFKNVALFVKKGNVTVKGLGLRSYKRDMSGIIKREFKDPELRKIYDCAVRTFAHNVVDIYMDCPTRERAGWLCDSYFTGRAEHFFFGTTDVEDAFLENYILYQSEGEYPEGLLPMVYPADPHDNCKVIPQWSMWYVLEVCEYLDIRNPKADKERFRPSVMGVLSFLEKHENELGLLEHLTGWNFIEWSKANGWCYDVSYPTNMLYSALLCAVEDTFGVSGLKEKARKLRETVIEMSFNGEVFIDNAVRDSEGVLKNTHNVSEACQYYAVLFGDVDLENKKFAELYKTIKKGFGEFAEKNSEKYDFCPINAFIGMYLRMNLLHNIGDPALMSENLKTFFGGMCDLTGTLWELKTPVGSLDHGFASYAACTIPLADSEN